MQVALTALVRFLVEVPCEFEYRMFIRNEMMSSGLANVFRVLAPNPENTVMGTS